MTFGQNVTINLGQSLTIKMAKNRTAPMVVCSFACALSPMCISQCFWGCCKHGKSLLAKFRIYKINCQTAIAGKRIRLQSGVPFSVSCCLQSQAKTRDCSLEQNILSFSYFGCSECVFGLPTVQKKWKITCFARARNSNTTVVRIKNLF